MKKFTAKKAGTGLAFRTFVGKKSKKRYLVFQTLDGGFHVFAEVQAKRAARDCGAKGDINTRQLWQAVWNRRSAKAN